MMTPMFLSQTNTEYFDLNQDHSHEDQQEQVLESPPFYPCYIAASDISSLHLEQGLGISDQSLTFDQLDGSRSTIVNMVLPTYGAQMTRTNNYGSQNHEIFTFKKQEDQESNSQNSVGGIATENGSSLRWMTSKMRMMRRMINSDNSKSGPRNGSRIISASNNPDQGPRVNATFNTDIDNNGIRVCSDCNTTKTPLWRSGPRGPKTLCNACGIRQRKARKAAMDAAAKNNSCEAASSSTYTKTTIKLKINKENNKSRATSNISVSKSINKKQATCNKQEANQLIAESDHNNSSSITSDSSKRQMVFEEFALNFLSKNAAYHRMFPKDEEEGALLLMALSYGIIET